MSIRLNGKYLVTYGTVVPDTIKHFDSEGNEVKAEVFTLKQYPFYDPTLEEALETGHSVWKDTYHNGTVVWFTVTDTATGMIVYKRSYAGMLGGDESFREFVDSTGKGYVLEEAI